MQWTKEQREVIEDRDHNIIVSAAAGSGKTAVMVERIVSLITEDNVPIDNMLVVTFTKAAASEMKEKIRKRIRAELRQSNEEAKAALSEDRDGRISSNMTDMHLSELKGKIKNLKEQLDSVPRANISTFHGFALDVVKTFFYETDLDSDFNICDEAKAALLQEEALDDLMRSRYEENSDDFRDFLNMYASEKDDAAVRQMIVSAYSAVKPLPDSMSELDKAISGLNLSDEKFWGSGTADEFFAQTAVRLTEAYESYEKAMVMLSDAQLERMSELLRPLTDWSRTAADAFKSHDQAGIRKIMMHRPDNPKIMARKEEKTLYEDVKDAVSCLRKRAKALTDDVLNGIPRDDINLLASETRLTFEPASVLRSLVKEYSDRYDQKKRDESLIDFDDIEHYCLSILENASETDENTAADYYRERFRYIFVDEYQDTSVMQDAIIEKIKRENNIFVVGDIKQCIYQFRLAEPANFRRRYRLYADCSDETSKKIDLNRNFRSKPPILEEVNRIFKPIMDDYDDEAALYAGIEYTGEYSFVPETVLVDLVNKDKTNDVPDGVMELGRHELEAEAVCDLIEENLGKIYHQPVWNPDENIFEWEERKLRYRDIVILMKTVRTTAPVFYDVMKRRGIPAYVDADDGYFDTMEINVFMNLLKVIDNKYRDTEFISVLRSEIFGFSVNELAEVRLDEKDGSYVETFINYAENNPKAAAVMKKLALWKELSGTMELPEFIWKLMVDTRYYMIMGAMPDGSRRQANLSALVDRAENFVRGGQKSLFDLISYLTKVKENGMRVGEAKLIGEGDDVVRVMTIHRSKGLEFPLVIVSGMGKNLRQKGGGIREKEKVLFHKDIGIGLYLSNPKLNLEKPSPICDLIRTRLLSEEQEENLRVLYVAMTRAREKLYLTGTVKDAEELLRSKAAGITGESTYFDAVPELPNPRIIDPFENLTHLISTDGTKDRGEHCQGIIEFDNVNNEMANVYKPSAQLQDNGESDTVIKPGTKFDDADEYGQKAGTDDEEVKRRMEYVYPHKTWRKFRAKYSVTYLNNSKLTKDDSVFHANKTHSMDDNSLRPLIGDYAEEYEQEVGIPEIRISDKGENISIRRGNAYHMLMKQVDLVKAFENGRNYLDNFISGLVKHDLLRPEDADLLNADDVLDFINTPLGIRAIQAFKREELYRERAFNLRCAPFDADIPGSIEPKKQDFIMVQGVIDCFFREDDGIVLLDYKTNRVGRRNMDKDIKNISDLYRRQMQIYSRALSKALDEPVKDKYLYLFDIGKEIRV